VVRWLLLRYLNGHGFRLDFPAEKPRKAGAKTNSKGIGIGNQRRLLHSRFSPDGNRIGHRDGAAANKIPPPPSLLFYNPLGSLGRLGEEIPRSLIPSLARSCCSPLRSNPSPRFHPSARLAGPIPLPPPHPGKGGNR